MVDDVEEWQPLGPHAAALEKDEDVVTAIKPPTTFISGEIKRDKTTCTVPVCEEKRVPQIIGKQSGRFCDYHTQVYSGPNGGETIYPMAGQKMGDEALEAADRKSGWAWDKVPPPEVEEDDDDLLMTHLAETHTVLVGDMNNLATHISALITAIDEQDISNIDTILEDFDNGSMSVMASGSEWVSLMEEASKAIKEAGDAKD